jgi:adenylate cyclase
VEELWRAALTGENPVYRRPRKVLQHIPSSPRCEFCAAPFRGIFVPLMRRMGRGQWPRNTRYCSQCFHFLEATHGGAEIDCSLLFADVRGSTSLAEQMSAAEFRALMDRFYRTASEILVREDGILDKFVGDEVVAIFIPALAQNHAGQALSAARALLQATGHDDQAGPWLPVGAGIASGMAYVGAVGSTYVEFTALGDIVNTAARLASASAAGEILVTIPAAERAGVNLASTERRLLDLKGKSAQVDVAVIRG